MQRFLIALAALAVVAGPAAAATSPFAGTWKLNVAKSKFTGETVTVTKTTDGFHFSNGATIAFDFKIDGKDYPIVPGRTVAWTTAPDGGYDAVTKGEGKVLSKAHRTFSADGTIMTAAYTEYRPDGSVVHESDTFKRLSGVGGLAGRWENVKAQSVSDTVIIDTPSAGLYQVAYPSEKELMVGPLDGTPTPIKGPTIPPGAMVSYKGVSGGAWTYEITLLGKVYTKGVMTVSDGAKTLTDKSWTPGKETEAAVAVYDRL